jgi:uncharacterized phage-associated protein
MNDAMDFAIRFIQQRKDTPRNTKSGNMKLQKLLYFSQLIHLAKFDKPLFENKMYAFKNGTVIEEVRQAYQHNHDALIYQSYEKIFEFDEEQNFTLNAAIDIFGEFNANELSDLNHEQFSWKNAYRKSIRNNGYHEKEVSIINLSDLKQYDINKIKIMLASYEDKQITKDECVIVNDVHFYFNPSETHINEEMMIELENFQGNENSYFVYYDDNLGVVIY